MADIFARFPLPDSIMDALQCMSGVNTQTLSTTARQQLIDSCQRLLRQAQASAELGTALAVELPKFTGFGKQALIRLGTLVRAHQQEKGVLQGLDPLTLIIIGLSVSTRKLDRMGAADVTEIVSQATSLGQRCRAAFLEDAKVHEVIREHGSDAFIQSYHRLVAEDVFSRTVSSIEVQLEGHMKCIPYTIPHGIQFYSLTAFAISGTVTAYVPIDPVDCCVRFTTLFNESLLRSLFGYQLGVCDIRPFPLLALKDEVAPTLGQDTFSAIQTSFAWAKGQDAMTTECVKGIVYVGHVIVVDVMMNRSVCLDWVNSAIGT